MTEKGPDAEIITLDSGRKKDENYFDPNDIGDQEVVDRFLAQFYHPGALKRSSDELGVYVRELLSGEMQTPASPAQIDWRKRVVDLMVDVGGIDDSTFDHWAVVDGPFRDIFSALRRTYDNSKDVVNERKALILLLNLRAGVLERDDASRNSDEYWQNLVVRLVGS